MADRWFETVAVAQRRARRRLPGSVYGALVAGAEAGVTVRDNVAAFSELGFAPHVAGLPATREMATTVMGQQISLPVLISPTGVQAVHPDGEVAVARAAAARGTIMSLSSFASKPVEEVLAANPRTFFQMYWVGGRDEMALTQTNGRDIERFYGVRLSDEAVTSSLPSRADRSVTCLDCAPEPKRRPALPLRTHTRSAHLHYRQGTERALCDCRRYRTASCFLALRRVVS